MEKYQFQPIEPAPAPAAAVPAPPPSPDLSDETQYGDYMLPDPAILVRFPVAAVPQRPAQVALRADPNSDDIAAWRARGFPCPGPVKGNHYEVRCALVNRVLTPVGSPAGWLAARGWRVYLVPCHLGWVAR